ncbi:hypothetical protein ACU4HD_10930 [Cupriavidus basilensis]
MRIGRDRLFETRLVDQAEVAPAGVARIALAGMRADGLEQVEGTEREVRHVVPEPVVAATPDEPHIAAHDLFPGEGDTTIHIVKIVFRGMPERLRAAARLLRLVQDVTRFRFRTPAHGDRANQRNNQNDSSAAWIHRRPSLPKRIGHLSHYGLAPRSLDKPRNDLGISQGNCCNAVISASSPGVQELPKNGGSENPDNGLDAK